MTSYLEENPALPGGKIGERKDEDILRMSLHEPAMFQILVEKYQEPLARAAMRVVRSREEAEDIVQEAFVKIYKNADKFQKLDGIEFKSWAYKVAVNTAITHYRKLKRNPLAVEDPAVFQEVGEELVAERFSVAADAKAAVAGVLAKMPGHLQSVMKRYYLEDKSYRTIAEEEKISIPTLKMRLFRAKKIFKKLSTNENHE